VEDQQDRILDEMIKVSSCLPVDDVLVEQIIRVKEETQFTKVIDSLKLGIPQALLINGLHADTDEECLDIATIISDVMSELAERMGQSMKDEA
jgi:hypothetical protein